MEHREAAKNYLHMGDACFDANPERAMRAFEAAKVHTLMALLEDMPLGVLQDIALAIKSRS